MQIITCRCKPGQDLKQEIIRLTKKYQIQAGTILSGVGSLQQAILRYADSCTIATIPGPLEIVSLIGTLSPDDVHLHMSVSDKNGKVQGGHLKEGCRIYTTAEIVLLKIEGLQFKRKEDKTTGYPELVVKRDRLKKRVKIQTKWQK